MESSNTQSADTRVEMFLGNLLRLGVLTASAVVLVGAVVYLVQEGTAVPDRHIFSGEPPDLRTIQGIIADSLAGRGRGIIQLGILLLIATPVARVFFSVVAFVWQRDLLYSLTTILVFGILLFSLLRSLG